MDESEKRILDYLVGGYPLVLLITWEEERAREILVKVAKSRGKAVTKWSPVTGFGDGKGADPGDTLTRIGATEGPRVFLLFDFHLYFDDPLVTRRLKELAPVLEKKDQCLVIASPSGAVPYELTKEMVATELSPPSAEEVGNILDSTAGQTGSLEKLQQAPELREMLVRAAMGLTGREAKRIFRLALSSGEEPGRETVKTVLDEKKQALRRSEYLEFYEVRQSLEDVGGLDLLKKWLSARADAFGERAKKYGLPEPKGLLLLGVQGCGKSLSAKAVSSLWGIPLIRLDLSTVMAGQGEGDTMRRALRATEELSPCVLWIDEIEKGFSNQLISGVQDSGEMARAFATFLIWLQEKEKPVYVIATANSVSELPPELLRKGRFDDIFFVDLPQPAERMHILGIHLGKRGRDPDNFDIEEAVRITEQFSGSELEQVVISAMYDAFTRGEEVETSHLVRSIRETVPLSETMEENIKELRDWAKTRARPASLDTKLMDLLGGGKS